MNDRALVGLDAAPTAGRSVWTPLQQPPREGSERKILGDFCCRFPLNLSGSISVGLDTTTNDHLVGVQTTHPAATATRSFIYYNVDLYSDMDAGGNASQTHTPLSGSLLSHSEL